MNVVAGPVGSLIGKLGSLLKEEYKLQKGARAEVERLRKDLESADAALRLVAQIPPEQLDDTDKLWARDIREASYDMEDIVDAFLVRVDGGDGPAAAGKDHQLLAKLWVKMKSPFAKTKARHEIGRAIKDVRRKLEDVASRHDGTSILQSIKAKNPAAPIPVSSRLLAMHSDVKKLVGIDKARDDLISMLKPHKDEDDNVSSKEMKKVSVVGVGGLGKTTIAKVVYDELKGDFKYATYVTVGQKPDLEGVLRQILIGLDKKTYSGQLNITQWSEELLVEELKEFLTNKRYLIFIDDIWDTESWKRITPALKETNKGSCIITTTRDTDVAKEVGCSYKLQPLSRENSRILFYGRIFGSKEECPEIFTKVSENILKKCGDVPLAIITISGLLDNKPKNITEWNKVYKSIGSGHGKDKHMLDMRNILSLSYYDLPPHLKTCLLYLSIFPEDYEIQSHELIWRWIGEGFIREQSDCIFELGKSYFNELINRSLILPGRGDSKYGFSSCRVHDMVLDFIRSTSNEENFVTVLAGTEQNASPGSKVRRLSLLKYNATTKKDKATTDLLQVRSFIAFTRPVDLLTFFSRFGVLRLLDLGEFHDESQDTIIDLSCIGNLTHLRYLRLGRMKLPDELPAEIGKLHFLQILCLYQGYPRLPSNIVGGLRGLLRLNGVEVRKLQNGIWGSIEVLNRLIVDEDSTAINIMKELGQLTQLRMLWIDIHISVDQSLLNVMFKSLSNLKKLQGISIQGAGDGPLEWNNWVPPPDIQTIVFGCFCTFLELPKWISNSIALPLLCTLSLNVLRVKPEDIEILGKLPSLRCLQLVGGEFGPVFWVEGMGPLDKYFDSHRSNLHSLA
ncbi:hypothetical protein ACP4OV_024503 [Aristida adscensionis]